VEIISIPMPGVKEKPYQCANRTGVFEAAPKFYTDKLAKIEHSACFHKGDDCCRYIISWQKMPYLFWKRIRNSFILFSVLTSLILLWLLTPPTWGCAVLGFATLSAAISYYAEYLEKKDLIHTIEIQKATAEDQILESTIRYNNALLVQEIGQATSKILAIDELFKSVATVMKKRLDFDRGIIMLANESKTLLRYTAGYGYTEEQEAFLGRLEFNLNNPDSKGLFVQAMRDHKPILIKDIGEIEDALSPRSLEFVKYMGGQSVICVPISYEQEALGILAVDNIKSKTPLRQSDMNLLMGLASQLATSIMNAKAFRKLHQSEKKYRELVETANSIILRMDSDGHLAYSNDFAQRFFGYSEKEMLGKNAEQIVLPANQANRKGFEKLVTSLQKDPNQLRVSENDTHLKTGQKAWIAWTYKPIFSEEGQFKEILCVGIDITERKLADIEKKDLQAQLQRAQKMEAIGTLAGGVAHDLNNILSGIVSYPELILMDLDENSPLRKPLLTIQKSGERAAAIVQDLLTLARRGVETTEVINLNSIVSEYLLSPEHARLESNHPAVTFETHLDENLLNILGSPVHLSKTVMNLVSNSAEAMPGGGKVIISSENRHLDRVKIGFDDIDKGDYATLTVADSGVGIAPEDIERIFEPFYTKKTMGKSGTGLGLAVVWGTVKDHQGKIDIKSVEGKGTEITLYFPAAHHLLARAADLAHLEDLMGKGESILVVDDIKEQRTIASEMLEKLGYRVTTVPSGEEAVKYLREHTADLVVLDMIMEPGMDGLETYKQILAIRPAQKSIIASGYSESIRVKEAQRLGAGAYVKKPYLLGKIAWAVKTELERIR
jgi:PAS domain S-box-containing protein